MGKSKNSYFIEAKRIYLREVYLSDTTGNYYCWMNDPQIIRFLESRFAPQSIAMLQSYVRQEEENPNSVFMGIIAKNNDEHIGNIKIHGIDNLHRHAQLSIIIGEKKYWGRGYGTEAIKLAVNFAFNTLNLHRLTAGIYANNVASIKAFKKANFFEEGLRKEHRFYNGTYVDEVALAIIRTPDKTHKA